MDSEKEKEEKLRESACIGDMAQLKQLVESEHVNLNSQNTINGWTALHWASKRNHVTVVKYLLSVGADKAVQNFNGDLPAQLTTTEEIRTLLEYSGSTVKSAPLDITPNYIRHPVFPYSSDVQSNTPQMNNHVSQQPVPSVNNDSSELVLKARIAYSDERDFIEVEMTKNNLTFEALMSLLTRELGVERRLVYKIRKLPNTIVRKDKDVKRLRDFQELELVLTNKAMSAVSRGYGEFSDGYRHEQILY